MPGGRKSIYEEKIKSRFSDIEKWMKSGATEKQIAEAIGVSASTWFKYKAETAEFSDFLKNISRTEVVLDLRSALLKKALGFRYTEKKVYRKKDEEGHISEYTEINEREALPDVAAINLALKNWDKDSWANDPQMLALKRDELELKKKLAEANEW